MLCLAVVALAMVSLASGEAADTLEDAPELVSAWGKELEPKQGHLGEDGGKQAKDSMKEIVPAAKMHAGVKQQVVEEEKRELPFA